MIVVMAALVTQICGDSAARAATTERVVADRITGLAIGGVDPVAFFTKGRTTIGRPDVEASEAGVIWRFENVDNRAFSCPSGNLWTSVRRLRPGRCGAGVAYAGNPRFWLIAGQRLYLFGREESRDAFAADPASVLREARDRWPQLEETLAR